METLLYQTLLSDAQVRQHATNELRKVQIGNHSNYAKDMCSILANEELIDPIRLSAGLALKNSLSSSNSRSAINWLFTDPITRNQIKSKIISLLDTKRRNVANVISQVLAAIAVIELPEKQWDGLIDILLCNVTSNYAASHLKQTILQAIGYICELIDPSVLSTEQCNNILTAIIEGARREQPDVFVRQTAIVALYNSLEFIQRNFDNAIERDFIMKVVCDGATQHVNSTIELQVSSYECLNRIMQLYYHKMEDYMSSLLFNLTINGMIQSNLKITYQAIEFWCTVCNIEIDLDKNNSATTSSLSFARQSVTYVLPSIFTMLIKDINEEYDDDNDDETSLSKRAAECLSVFALCTKEMVVPQTIEFISNNLLVGGLYKSLSWNQKEAAIVAFGSMIEGPCKLQTIPLVNQMLPVLLASMNDTTTPYIPVAASCTLSQIIKQSIKVLDVPNVLKNLVPVILKGLYSEHQKIVYNCCLFLIYLSQQLKFTVPNTNMEADEGIVIMETSPLSTFTENILTNLLAITMTTNTRYDIKSRCTIYETMSSVITNASRDCNKSVYIVTSTIIDRLDKLSILAKMKEYHDDNFWNLQTSLLSVLTNCVYRLKSEAIEYSERIMSLVFRTNQLYLNDNNSNGLSITIVEDTFLLVSALINSTGKKFHRYIDHFLPDLSKILTRQLYQQHQHGSSKDNNDIHGIMTIATTNKEETLLSLISVGIMSDISTTFGEAIFPYSGEFMKLLVNNLKSKRLHRDVKPVTLSCIGDVAQAIGPVFVPYVDTVMMILKQAGNMQAEEGNQEVVEYVDAIRVGTLEAFIGMIIGLSQNAATKEILLPFVIDFIFYVSSIIMDKNRSDRLTRTIIGLLGDIARVYGKRIKYTLVENLLNQLVIENSKGELYFSKTTKGMAHWAQKTMITVYHNK